MFERFTDRARRVVVLAQEESRLLNHNYIGTEHLLLGLVHEKEGVAAGALADFGIGLDEVRREVEEIIGRGSEAPAGHIPFTPRAKRVLELGLKEALGLGHNYIGTEHILLGLMREGEGVAAQVLAPRADFSRLRQAVIDRLAEAPAEPIGQRAARVNGMGRLELKGIRVMARHGELPEEAQQGQEFAVDLSLSLDLAPAGASDRLEDTVDYAELARRVAARVTEERWNLIERVAERVAELVLEDPRVRRVEVTVHKPAAPLEVPVDDVSVTVVRAR